LVKLKTLSIKGQIYLNWVWMARFTWYNIMLLFVSDLLEVIGVLGVLQIPLAIKLTSTI
jgi:hypothetical protein